MKIISFLCLLALPLLSQESSNADTPVKNWYLFMQGGGGSASAGSGSGTAVNGLLGFEYRETKTVGYGISLGGTQLNMQKKSTGLDDNTLLLLLASPRQNSGNLLQALVLMNMAGSATGGNSMSANIGTASLNLNFHLNGDSFFDPYIGFGLVGGSCIGSSCSVGGGLLKLGIQFNYDTFFYYLECQGQSLSLSGAYGQTNIGLGNLGAGFRF